VGNSVKFLYDFGILRLGILTDGNRVFCALKINNGYYSIGYDVSLYILDIVAW
jgi:L-cysteine desulfidase